ncbi:hypothetical protein Y032_0413g991 [Ancylostoma ceylanicum]|uniref:Secreted protein n=1 Tax=Ancylostoma ceylanicum TaxID=53326 RepID=A0A016X3W3_9BILA|nr:hypothetical protein Y032_0413g991 [Ancylostoma ceylanicum]
MNCCFLLFTPLTLKGTPATDAHATRYTLPRRDCLWAGNKRASVDDGVNQTARVPAKRDVPCEPQQLEFPGFTTALLAKVAFRITS